MSSKRRVLARISPQEIRIGAVFEPNDPDHSVEHRFFRGWERIQPKLGVFSRWLVVEEDDGTHVLEKNRVFPRGLITAAARSRDCVIEADVSVLSSISYPPREEPYDNIGRAGIIFQYQDEKRFYLYCIEAYSALILYRREAAGLSKLAMEHLGFDRTKYYRMTVECIGNKITCYLDGQRKFEVLEDVYGAGKAGIFASSEARFREVEIRTPGDLPTAAGTC